MHTEQELGLNVASSQIARRYKRHRVRVPVTLTTSTGEVLQGLTNDFSERGMALYISCRFEVGQLVRLEFQMPASKDTVNIDALVRDCNGFRYGVEFQALNTIEEMLLSNSCCRLSALLSTPVQKLSLAHCNS